jgi:low temperature requirement protein LtrA
VPAAAADAARPSPPSRHLRRRGGEGAQPTTTPELFFDLVYVFAVTQLSHLVLGDLSVGGLARAAFLLVVVWWAWIYTTWMTNLFNPESPAVRAVLGGVMLASLLAAAALPLAFGADALLFAAAYVVLQVGRNAAAMSLVRRDERPRDVYERLLVWSIASGVLWLLGAVVADDRRMLFWGPAFVLDLLAPIAGYWLPGRGRAATADYDVEAGHFTERCQLFVLIALGESIVVTGGGAAEHGLTAGTVACLVIAFLQTLALWALYFGPTAERSRRAVLAGENPGRLARDAYTYIHIPIIAGIVLAAAADHLLIAEPTATPHGVAVVLFLAGPALFLLGDAFFRRVATGRLDPRPILLTLVLAALVPLAPHVPIVALYAVVTALLGAVAIEEVGAPTPAGWWT